MRNLIGCLSPDSIPKRSRMHEYITIPHNLPHFDVTEEPQWLECTTGSLLVKTKGRITLPHPQYCPKCNAKVYSHSYETVRIKDIPLMKSPNILEVYTVWNSLQDYNSLQGRRSFHYRETETTDLFIPANRNEHEDGLPAYRSRCAHYQGN